MATILPSRSRRQPSCAATRSVNDRPPLITKSSMATLLTSFGSLFRWPAVLALYASRSTGSPRACRACSPVDRRSWLKKAQVLVDLAPTKPWSVEDHTGWPVDERTAVLAGTCFVESSFRTPAPWSGRQSWPSRWPMPRSSPRKAASEEAVQVVDRPTVWNTCKANCLISAGGVLPVRPRPAGPRSRTGSSRWQGCSPSPGDEPGL